MGDLKPLGSEKLQGDDKLKRILELTYYGNKPKTPVYEKSEYISESYNGVYGIIKEKDGYYVKKGLNESSLDYIGGLFMKNKNRFSSYSEALKRLKLLSGQDLQEATKYVLKQKPTDETGMSPNPSEGVPPMPSEPMPSPEIPAEPSAEMPVEPSPEDSTDMGSELPMEEPGSEETGGNKPSDYMAEVQKFAGKLGQELRDQKSKMESDDIKYVLNMIISAVDLEKLDEEDIEEIGKKFDREEDNESELPSEEPELPLEEPELPEEEPEDEDLSEVMDKLDRFINTPVHTDEIDLSTYDDLGEEDVEPSSNQYQEKPKYSGFVGTNPMKDDSNDEDIQELDLDEIKKEINNSINSTLGKYFK
jgi:hypothetical protein